jgi:hypothetical protein
MPKGSGGLPAERRNVRLGASLVVALSAVAFLLAMALYGSGCEYCSHRPALFTVQVLVAGAGLLVAVTASCVAVSGPRNAAASLVLLTLTVEVTWVLVALSTNCPDQNSHACNGSAPVHQTRRLAIGR